MAQPTIDKSSTAKRGRSQGAKSNPVVPATSPESLADKSGDLTFITSEGEILTFPDTGLPPGDAAAIAGEEAVHKIWDRPAEDAAWRDM